MPAGGPFFAPIDACRIQTDRRAHTVEVETGVPAVLVQGMGLPYSSASKKGQTTLHHSLEPDNS